MSSGIRLAATTSAVGEHLPRCQRNLPSQCGTVFPRASQILGESAAGTHCPAKGTWLACPDGPLARARAEKAAAEVGPRPAPRAHATLRGSPLGYPQAGFGAGSFPDRTSVYLAGLHNGVRGLSSRTAEGLTEGLSELYQALPLPDSTNW